MHPSKVVINETERRELPFALGERLGKIAFELALYLFFIENLRCVACKKLLIMKQQTIATQVSQATCGSYVYEVGLSQTHEVLEEGLERVAMQLADLLLHKEPD